MHTCIQCSEQFEVDQDFLERVSPTYAGKKMSIPPSQCCPQCRLQRRLAFRNDRTFYTRTCDLTGEQYVSIYAPDAPYTVYRPTPWYGDGWDPMDFGRENDVEQSFFDQFDALMKDVPQLGIDIVNCQNSEYCNYCGDDKNCYLDIAGEANEDCYYNLFIKWCKNCCDCTFCYHSTLCYECIQCYNAYNCRYSQYLDDCSDCAFCFDLKGCKNCLLSVNLRNKQYYILNKPHTREEYERKLAELRMGSSSALQNVFALWMKMRIEKGIYRDMYNLSCEQCSGNNIKNSKNCFQCFNATNCEDCKHLYDVLDAKDCQDLNYSLYKPEVAYELISTLQMRFSAFCYASHYLSNCYYCVMCNNSSDCFGCIGLNRKQYCVLNKQYSKEEYEELVPKIIEQMRNSRDWGEFFPGGIAPFAYNETVAQEYMPLTQEEAKKRGYRWREESAQQQQEPTATVPDAIADADDELCSAVLQCEVSKEPYRIIPQELALYRKQNIPVPRRSPMQRHKDRMALRNPRTLWNRECSKCTQAIQTTYAPDRPETVYCEECYLEAVY